MPNGRRAIAWREKKKVKKLVKACRIDFPQVRFSVFPSQQSDDANKREEFK
jgi:hypothetical protein